MVDNKILMIVAVVLIAAAAFVYMGGMETTLITEETMEPEIKEPTTESTVETQVSVPTTEVKTTVEVL